MAWNGDSPEFTQLTDISKFAPLKIGDTIVSGGQSAIFPKGIDIGYIDSFETDISGDTYNVQVKLFNDMTNLGTVYIIENFDKLIRQPLKKRVHYWAIGVAIYTLSLTFGLHLLIFGIGNLIGKGGFIGTFYGVMLGLTGFAIGNMYVLHTKKYEAVFDQKYDLSLIDFKMK